MPDHIDIEEILSFSEHQQANHNPEQDLEQILLNSILNPEQLKVQRVRIVDSPNTEMVYELREGVVINHAGIPEEIQELVINAQALSDGTPMNTFGIVRCMNCNSVVRETSMTRCPCGRTICLSHGCALYSKTTDTWYCCFWHKFLGSFGINLR